MIRHSLLTGLLASALVLPAAGMARAEDGRNRPYQVAQSTDSGYRVIELEEQVRNLTGKVEELSFQLLQLQEELRKMKEDNEFRFQEIEEKQGSAPPEKTDDVAKADEEADDRLGKSEPSGQNGDTPRPGGDAETMKDEIGTLIPKDQKRGAEPRLLGTLEFDKDGNVVGTGIDGPVDLTGPQDALPDGGATSLPFGKGTEGAVDASQFGSTPTEVFGAGKTFYESKDYKRAESAFRAHLVAWPKDPREPEARYYLGQSLFWQKRYYDAANIFLDTHNAHPGAPTAPDTLLALGLSLAGLNQREVACATYAEVLKQYPLAEERLGARVKAEQESARC